MKVEIKLDSSSIDDAIKQIEDYRKDLLKKLKVFTNALLQKGVSVANARLASTQGDSSGGAIGFGVDDGGNIVSARITLSGTEALFIEFGAGIAYNTGAQDPKAAEFGYGPGTYPSKHPPNKAITPGYWYYGSGQRSIGTEASMPIYYAAETMRNEAIKTASEIFRR